MNNRLYTRQKNAFSRQQKSLIQNIMSNSLDKDGVCISGTPTIDTTWVSLEYNSDDTDDEDHFPELTPVNMSRKPYTETKQTNVYENQQPSDILINNTTKTLPLKVLFQGVEGEVKGKIKSPVSQVSSEDAWPCSTDSALQSEFLKIIQAANHSLPSNKAFVLFCLTLVKNHPPKLENRYRLARGLLAFLRKSKMNLEQKQKLVVALMECMGEHAGKMDQDTLVVWHSWLEKEVCTFLKFLYDHYDQPGLLSKLWWRHKSVH